jgi:hypothetical protein
MGSGSNPADEYGCVDVRCSDRDRVEHADVSNTEVRHIGKRFVEAGKALSLVAR